MTTQGCAARRIRLQLSLAMHFSCMYVCMYVCVYIYIYIYVRIYNIYMYISCMYIYSITHAYICMCSPGRHLQQRLCLSDASQTYICIHTYTHLLCECIISKYITVQYMHIYIHMIWIYIYIYIHVDTVQYMHIYMHVLTREASPAATLSQWQHALQHIIIWCAYNLHECIHTYTCTYIHIHACTHQGGISSSDFVSVTALSALNISIVTNVESARVVGLVDLNTSDPNLYVYVCICMHVCVYVCMCMCVLGKLLV